MLFEIAPAYLYSLEWPNGIIRNLLQFSDAYDCNETYKPETQDQVVFEILKCAEVSTAFPAYLIYDGFQI
jgi:hypothetical protein